MKLAIVLLPLLTLSACEMPRTKEDCPIAVGSIGRFERQACLQAYAGQSRPQQGAVLVR